MIYRNIKTLLLEGDMEAAAIICKLLSDIDNPSFIIKIFNNLSSGLDCLEKEKFDLIMADLFLSDSRGLETLLKIREKAENIPIIILAGDNTIPAIDAVHNGAQDYLLKGELNSVSLVRSISYAIERKEAELELSRRRHGLEEMVKESAADLIKEHKQIHGEIVKRGKSKSRFSKLRKFFNTALQTTPDIFVLKDTHSVYQAVNPAFCEFLGKSEEEIIGKTDKDLFSAEEAEIYIADDEKVIKTGRTQIQDELVSGGEQRWLQVAKTPLIGAGDECVGILCFVRDISESKRAEDILRRANLTLVTLSVCNQTVLQATEEIKLTEEVCRIIVEIGGYSLAWVGYAEYDDDKIMRPVASWGNSQGYMDNIKAGWGENNWGKGPVGEAFRSGKQCIIQNILCNAGHREWQSEINKFGYHSFMSLPLCHEEYLLGTLNIYSSKANAFKEEEINLLTMLAKNLSYGIIALRIRIEREKAEAELKSAYDVLEVRVKERTSEIEKVNRELETEITERKEAQAALQRKHNVQSVLNAMLSLSMKPYSLKEMLSRILKQIFTLPWLKLQSQGAIFLVEDDELVLKAHRGLPLELHTACARVPFGHCICGMAAQKKEMQFIDCVDIHHDNRYRGMQPHGHYCIPILSSNKLLGVLTLYIPAGYIKDIDEEIFLRSIVHVLAGIIERKLLEDQLNKLAHFDFLTGLPNRKLFFDRFNQMLALSRRSKCKIALLFLDLDGFKKINDTLGHKAGDILLREVAGRLLNCVRETDTVTRMGGDEFAVILTDVTRMQNAINIAQKIIISIAKPFEIQGHGCSVGISVGIALYPYDGMDAETLLLNADSAMYCAKSEGPNNYHCYNAQMRKKALERITRENEIRKALKRKEFIMYYQPQIDIHTGQIASVEALIRWQHPEEGLILPRNFIPLAEESGLILEIDEYVLRAACSQYRIWQRANIHLPRVAINISVRWFKQKDQIGRIQAVLCDTNLPADFLEVELTERVFMENADPVIEKLMLLKNNGISLAIDDFGTGYSSLGYLKRFPICKLKIDRSFIRDITANNNDVAIVTAIINMAHSMNLKTVAEGVETKEQLEILRKLNCDEVQGFLLCKPLPSGKFIEMMAERFKNKK